MGTRIAPEDLTWLLMDEPHNLMHVNGLIGFDELPDTDALVDIVMERMVRKYRVLSQVAVKRDGAWMWEDDVDFDIHRHVRRVTLDDASTDAVRDYVSAQLSVPFDRLRPLWEIQILTGPDGDGGYVYHRFHHGIGDGIRLVQMLLALCDPAEGAAPAAVGRNTSGDHHPLGLLHHLGDAFDLARHPHKLVDALSGLASTDNTVANSVREIGRMLLSDGHDAEAWSGHAGVDKSVAWVEGVPLDGLRAVARARGATLNDVLLAAVSLALGDYLAERRISDVTDLSWMMPVSLQPIDTALPDRLGNHFVVVMLSMPLGIHDAGDLIDEIHRRTTRLKHSAEPMVAYGFQRVVAESPAAVARRLTTFFTGKTIGQLTNVPGPRVAMTLAGAPVRSILGWVPTSGDQPLGVSLFSYDDTLSVGVATDHRMIPDPLHFVELVEHHLAALAQTAPTAQITHEGAR
jgi:diacylglycerol O-acyltransferase